MAFTKNNEIYFPHTFPGAPGRAEMAGVQFEYNSIDGGFVKVEDLGYLENGFLGGNVKQIGKVTKYGFFVCPHRVSKTILAFHVERGGDLTAAGRKLIEKRFPDAKIIYKDYERVEADTKETREQRDNAIAEFQSVGGNPIMVRTVTAREIMSIVKALKAGVPATPVATVEPKAVAPAADPGQTAPMTHSSGKGKPPRKVVDEMISSTKAKAAKVSVS